MKRLAWAFGLLGLAVPLGADAKAELDPAVNGLRLGRDALRTYDFESAAALVGVELATWGATEQGVPMLERRKVARPDEIASRLTSAAEDAVEGAHALRLGGDGTGLLIADPALFSQVKDKKLEVTLWTRADGASPSIQVIYDRDPANIYAGGAQFATVRAIRTGRQTNDGWAEFSTGPLDGNVWGTPVQAILVTPSFYAAEGTTFLVDALEIRALDGKPTPALACTQQTVDATCGPEADCMFGRCVSSTVTWGALPPLAHRTEIAERWIQFGTRLIGDRNAAQHGVSILTPGARAIAKNAVSSRQFFGGLNRLVNLLRDNHTSFGSPANYTSFAPQIGHGSSSALGACFGVVEKDIMGGGLGYAVFRAGQNPLTGVQLQRGDVVFAIDGRDPKQWVDEAWPQFATTLPNDPAADWGPSANDLSRLVTTRASTITIARCASESACEGDARQTFTIDVASAVYAAVTSPQTGSTSQSFGCTQRFTNSVAGSGGGGFGEDPVLSAAGALGETRVQFDGFVGRTKWKSAMTGVFAGAPENVIMDARMGHGGYYDTVEHLFNLLRGTNEPIGVFSVGRGTYDLTDPPWLVPRLGVCAGDQGPSLNGGSEMWGCFAGNANGFFTSSAAPPGATSRIAWLNTYDVSANDFMPRLLKGRTNVKIFAPHPTSGAFGAISPLPALATGWSGGSMQVQDARFAPSLASVSSARWESGHGVVPDVVVAQKLSDALTGVDTILQAASEWLANPN